MKRVLLFLAATAASVVAYVFLLSLMRGSAYDSGSVLAALILAIALASLSRIAFCLFNNAGEELAYRGYLLRQLALRFGSMAAVLSTSALFALLHVQAGVPWLSAVTAVFTSGVLFVVLLLRWKSLPLVIGFHVATNVAQEFIGLRVTGLSFVRPAFDTGLSPARQTSALVAVAVINVAIAITLARTPRAGRETT